MSMKLVRLTSDTDLSGFECGDDDLNKFLVEDARIFSACVLPHLLSLVIVKYKSLFNIHF